MNPSLLPLNAPAASRSGAPLDGGADVGERGADMTPMVEREAADALTVHAVPRASLTMDERVELFQLLSRHFEGVTASQFAQDLAEKDWVLRIRRGERLVGFTTLQVYAAECEGRVVNVVYSGDTITDPDVWGSPVLARGWIAMVRRIQADRLGEPWYWLLLSSGYRTYRFLPVFWREFWPRASQDTPPDIARLLVQLATQRFGERTRDGVGYCAATGVVRFAHPQRLRGDLARIPEGKLRDAHVEFFLQRNPTHAEGDELVCLTDLGDHNLTAAGARMLRTPSR